MVDGSSVYKLYFQKPNGKWLSKNASAFHTIIGAIVTSVVGGIDAPMTMLYVLYIILDNLTSYLRNHREKIYCLLHPFASLKIFLPLYPSVGHWWWVLIFFFLKNIIVADLNFMPKIFIATKTRWSMSFDVYCSHHGNIKFTFIILFLVSGKEIALCIERWVENFCEAGALVGYSISVTT